MKRDQGSGKGQREGREGEGHDWGLGDEGVTADVASRLIVTHR